MAKVFPSMNNDQIHIWFIDLDACKEHSLMITEDENELANKKLNAKLRHRFAATRSILRHLLSRYIDLSAKSIVFAKGEYGKPSIKDSKVFFNISHSHNIACFAFNFHDEIGIDVELQRNMNNLQGIAKRVFSPIERDYLFSNDADINDRFFTLWSRKEAVVKATGDGISTDLSKISTTLSDGSLNSSCHYMQSHNITLTDLETGKNIYASLAGSLKNKEIYYFNYDEYCSS
jgi:4'-phosphopantetheinyl transferase